MRRIGCLTVILSALFLTSINSSPSDSPPIALNLIAGEIVSNSGPVLKINATVKTSKNHIVADGYLVLQYIDGNTQAIVNLAGEGSKIEPFVQGYGVRTGTEGITIGVAGFSKGLYKMYALFVRPGGNPLDRRSWLSNLAWAAFQVVG